MGKPKPGALTGAVPSTAVPACCPPAAGLGWDQVGDLCLMQNRAGETWFAAGFGTCSIPWAEPFPPHTKLHFPGVRISAEAKFDVFNWYHHVHWWKITGQEWTARILWIRGFWQGKWFQAQMEMLRSGGMWHSECRCCVWLEKQSP